MKHFSTDELDFKDGSENEQIRTRKIFEELKQRGINDKKLLEREKDFLCLSLKLSLEKEDGKPEEFEFCKDFIFRELYLTYFHNNLSEPFFKAKKGKLVEVTHYEKVKDLKNLQIFSDKWQKVIEISNHKDQILLELTIETKRDLKELDIRFPRLVRKFRKQQDAYKLQKDKIILHSKFIYHLTKSVMEDYDKEQFKIPFSKQTIELTAYSYIHITSRHYAERIKDKPEKSFHYKNFYPKELHIDLKIILTEIDKLGLIDLNKTDNIIFQYDEVIYQLWIQKRTKQIKGEGNVIFNRIQSFYPIYNEEKITSINSDYKKSKINESLELFYKD